MKKTILFLGILVMVIAVHVVWAQQQEGVITYEVRVNLHRNIPAGEEGRKAMIPEFRSFKEQLFFNPEESLYKPLIEEEDEEDAASTAGGGGGGGVRMRFMRQRSETFCNQSSGKIVLKQEFMGKPYLIIDSIKVAPWKLGTETKTIAGYVCKQAYYTNEERKQTITAWYTDQFRPFLGPEQYNTLPGAVLALDINNGERVTSATKVEVRPLKKNELKEPVKGERTTRQEFRKMMEEQMKKMGGGRNGVIIRN